MNTRWTLPEEGKLLKLIASGKTCKELAGGFNRTDNALELRLKKIIYDNITNNKSIDKIAELLHMNKDVIMQHFYSYKDYIEKQNGGKQHENEISIKKESESKLNKLHQMNQINQINQINKINQIQDVNKFNQNGAGGNNIIKLEKLEEQNKKMKLILENYMLKNKITKLLKDKHNNLYKDAINALIE